MHSRLTELVADLAVHRASVLRAAESLPHAQWKRRPEAERWSVVEVYEHLARVEMGIGRLLAKRAADARVTGHPSETETASMLTSLDNFPVIDRSRRFPAPEQLLPPPDLEVASVLDHLATSRASLRFARQTSSATASSSVIAKIDHV